MTERPVHCCEHNPCPDRPTWWLSRFRERPWRCPQCGDWWITVYVAGYEGGSWNWRRTSSDDPRLT